jgi:hypothetical protein
MTSRQRKEQLLRVLHKQEQHSTPAQKMVGEEAPVE